MYWRSLFQRDVIHENPISGIHSIEFLESESPYLETKDNYFNRVKSTLKHIPSEYRDAALSVFAKVIYLPEPLLTSTYCYFGEKFFYRQGMRNAEEIGKRCHVFEVDPSGLANKFYQHNNIHQRLHPDYYPRIQDVNGISKLLSDVNHRTQSTVKGAVIDIKKLALKKHWIVLTDKALSGQSLLKDIERYVRFRSILTGVTGNEPVINVMAQVITEDALVKSRPVFGKLSNVTLDYAVLFDRSMKVNSDQCRLFESESIRAKVQDLCRWLAEEVMLDDPRFNTMREKSGDDLRYGYKACGLTLADAANCSTNSLPLLWYDNTREPMKRKYQGPYPRVHSRLGIQTEQPSDDAWGTIFKNERKIREKLNRLVNGS